MFKKITLFLSLLIPFGIYAQGPCTTTDATGCSCQNSSQTDCDLLPDITISDWAILNYNNGPTEYSQSGNGANDGRLRISGSTPNIGFGSFTVGSVSMWTCGTDTFTTFPGTCPNNGGDPKQLIKQKIYHKNGNTMSFTERWAGSMTYHPTHGHMHVDDWAVFTLRIEDTNDPNPLNWPIVGTGAKVGFCLMDFGTCSFYNGHCRDSSYNIMTNGDFPNYGLGGGNYNCSPVEQGISSGYTDIYGEHLDGMWIDIPPGTCNGDYWIVIEVDPNNNFMESREDNNWAAVPFTLTQQLPAGTGAAAITANGPTDLCDGSAVQLSANAGTSYLWSTGDTSQTITVSQPGSYTVQVTGPCGTASDTQTVTVRAPIQAPTATDDAVCDGGTVTLSASGNGGDLNWYDAQNGGNLLHTGSTFTTPMLSQTTTYYVEEEEVITGASGQVGPNPNVGGGTMHQNNTRYLEFDAHTDVEIVSVLVDAGSAGNRTVLLSSGAGATIASRVVYVPQGQSRVTLNFNVPQGTNYRLGLDPNSNTDLFRNNTGISYPYDLSGLVSITNSSAGGNYYYFYYDWEVKTPDRSCVGPRTAVTATVNPLPNVSFTGLNATYTDADAPVSLTGTPTGGVFTGPGITGNQFDPSLAGVGGPYTITYSYTDANGCVGTSTFDVTVNQATGILDDPAGSEGLIVFPNPNQGQFNVRFELLETHEVTLKVLDLAGKSVMSEDLGQFAGAFERSYTMDGLARGVYFVEVTVDQQKFYQKMIYQ